MQADGESKVEGGEERGGSHAQLPCEASCEPQTLGMDVEGALHSVSRRSETDVCGTSAFALDPLVCWEILDKRLSEKKEKKP